MMVESSWKKSPPVLNSHHSTAFFNALEKFRAELDKRDQKMAVTPELKEAARVLVANSHAFYPLLEFHNSLLDQSKTNRHLSWGLVALGGLLLLFAKEKTSEIIGLVAGLAGLASLIITGFLDKMKGNLDTIRGEIIKNIESANEILQDR